jgi:hypothetical protein
MKEPPLISRRYSVAGDPGRTVVLTISKPKRWRKDWACWIRIEGIPDGRGFAPGVDALQALQLAITSARMMLDASGLPLVWLEGKPGDVGIPLPVPNTYGFENQRRWERYLEREGRRLDLMAAARIRMKMSGRAIKKRLVAAVRRWIRRY